MSAQNWGKIFVGLIFITAGLWLIFPASWFTNMGLPGFGLWRHLWNFIQGTVPLLLVVIGLLLVWIESEELKARSADKK